MYVSLCPDFFMTFAMFFIVSVDCASFENIFLPVFVWFQNYVVATASRSRHIECQIENVRSCVFLSVCTRYRGCPRIPLPGFKRRSRVGFHSTNCNKQNAIVHLKDFQFRYLACLGKDRPWHLGQGSCV